MGGAGPGLHGPARRRLAQQAAVRSTWEARFLAEDARVSCDTLRTDGRFREARVQRACEAELALRAAATNSLRQLSAWAEFRNGSFHGGTSPVFHRAV
jgi:hypothetical protein